MASHSSLYILRKMLPAIAVLRYLRKRTASCTGPLKGEQPVEATV